MAIINGQHVQTGRWWKVVKLEFVMDLLLVIIADITVLMLQEEE